jgi:HlyD family secretion protein
MWVGTAAAVAAFLLWAFYPRATIVDVATVTRGTFVRTIDEDGKTRVRERYVVSAPLAGHLLRIALKAGDGVETGALLATLLPGDPALLDTRAVGELVERVGAAEARRMSTTANVTRARVAAELSQSELDRQKRLGEQGFASGQAVERAQRELELRTSDLAVAQFDDHAAEHELAMARAALSRARRSPGAPAAPQRIDIRAPVAGRVLRVLQESEATVPVGAPLVELGDPARLEAVVDVLTTDAESITAGAPVEFDLGSPAAALQGRVRLVEPAAFTKLSALGIEEQRVNVVIDLIATPAELARLRLGDGYRVDARILADRREEALLVPTGALFRHADGWAVFVVDNGRARETEVRVGARNARHAVADAGLDAGTRVIVYPADTVRDGARVTPR